MEAEEIARKVKKSKAWDHDIKFIDGRFVEDVVLEYQATRPGPKKEALLDKIIKNYRIYRLTWAKGFAQYIDSIEDGEILHDETIWKCCEKFKTENCLKERGRAFNAYYVSACLHQMKNLKSSMEAAKNYPRVTCPICEEEVHHINAKHLLHLVTLDRYKKTYRNHALASFDGTTVCPFSGERVAEITESLVNRHDGYYAVADYVREFGDSEAKGPFTCPVSRLVVDRIDASYLAGLMAGYTMEEFVQDFPECKGLIACGISKEKVVSIDQEYLDDLLRQKGRQRTTLDEFLKKNQTLTPKAKQEDVVNPYTGEKVREITIEMLRQAGTTVKTHLEKYATLFLCNNYREYVRCPFTGRKVKHFSREYLVTLGKTVYDFYNAVCKYPLKKWTVKCAVCGQWVTNIWDHLDAVKHTYAPSASVEQFENEYGSAAMKATVSTNAYFTNKEGESIHIADLFPQGKQVEMEQVELEDCLMTVAKDDLDKKIAKGVRNSQSLEDVWSSVSKESTVTLEEPVSEDDTPRTVIGAIASVLGTGEFDLREPIKVGEKAIKVVEPSRHAVKTRLIRMVMESEIGVRFLTAV